MSAVCVIEPNRVDNFQATVSVKEMASPFCQYWHRTKHSCNSGGDIYGRVILDAVTHGQHAYKILA